MTAVCTLVPSSMAQVVAGFGKTLAVWKALPVLFGGGSCGAKPFWTNNQEITDFHSLMENSTLLIINHFPFSKTNPTALREEFRKKTQSPKIMLLLALQETAKSRWVSPSGKRSSSYGWIGRHGASKEQTVDWKLENFANKKSKVFYWRCCFFNQTIHAYVVSGSYTQSANQTGIIYKYLWLNTTKAPSNQLLPISFPKKCKLTCIIILTRY